jgi:hypothetical protein
VNNIKIDLGKDWIYTAQDRDQWRALVNTAMNLTGSIKCCEVLGVDAQFAASQEELNSVSK